MTPTRTSPTEGLWCRPRRPTSGPGRPTSGPGRPTSGPSAGLRARPRNTRNYLQCTSSEDTIKVYIDAKAATLVSCGLAEKLVGRLEKLLLKDFTTGPMEDCTGHCKGQRRTKGSSRTLRWIREVCHTSIPSLNRYQTLRIWLGTQFSRPTPEVGPLQAEFWT